MFSRSVGSVQVVIIFYFQLPYDYDGVRGNLPISLRQSGRRAKVTIILQIA